MPLTVEDEKVRRVKEVDVLLVEDVVEGAVENVVEILLDIEDILEVLESLDLGGGGGGGGGFRAEAEEDVVVVQSSSQSLSSPSPSLSSLLVSCQRRSPFIARSSDILPSNATIKSKHLMAVIVGHQRI